jgi:hypothetical protein
MATMRTKRTLAMGALLLGSACFTSPPLPAPPSPEFNCPVPDPEAIEAAPLPAPGQSAAPEPWAADICGFSDHGLRRLNRTEYDRTIADLLGVDLKPARDFPQDDVGAGFDNMADLLTVSPLLMEKHEAAARAAVEAALRKDTTEPRVQLYEAESWVGGAGGVENRWARVAGKEPVRVIVDFPDHGDYVLRVRAYREPAEGPALPMSVSIGETTVASFEVAASADAPETYEVRVEQGWSIDTVAIALEDPAKGRRLFLDFLEVEGPFGAPVGPDPESRARLLTCSADDIGVEACALDIWRSFAERAWRRPVSDDEVRRYLPLLQVVADDPPDGADLAGLFEEGVALGLEAVLLSPRFLFKVELDDDAIAPTVPHAVDDHALAARLSYLLWGTMPDERLREIADMGSLQNDDVLAAEVERMLADPRSRSVVDDFIGQWLGLRGMDEIWRSDEVYPDFDGELRVNMQCETRLFVNEVLREGGTAYDLLDADFTFVSERLAGHYGIDGVVGDGWHRVSTEGVARNGLLTHGSVLTLTSHPERTSVVKRGKWVLDNLLCMPPAPPPPGVEGLPEEGPDAEGSLRERLERHRADPVCASCHDAMDPIGFGLENYDATGAWRDTDGAWDIDSSGLYMGWAEFEGAEELTALIRDEPDYTRCVAEKAMTYALGRPLDERDACAVDELVTAWTDGGARLTDLFVLMAKSPAFRLREGASE